MKSTHCDYTQQFNDWHLGLKRYCGLCLSRRLATFRLSPKGHPRPWVK